MTTEDYAITFACYNQVEYTRRCIDSLVATGADRARIVAVDNGSTTICHGCNRNGCLDAQHGSIPGKNASSPL